MCELVEVATLEYFYGAITDIWVVVLLVQTTKTFFSLLLVLCHAPYELLRGSFWYV